MRLFPTFLRRGLPGAPHRPHERVHLCPQPLLSALQWPFLPKFHGACTPHDGQQGPFTTRDCAPALAAAASPGTRGGTSAPQWGECDVLEKGTRSRGSWSPWEGLPTWAGHQPVPTGTATEIPRVCVAEAALHWVRTADGITSARPSRGLPPLDETVSRMLASGCLSLGPR